MRKFMRGLGITLIMGLALMVILPQMSMATSQWSRKYKVSCTFCHTTFPRLNQFGEQFMRNGYQMPDTQDGDENKTAVGGKTVIDELGNFFGVRLNFTPLEIKENVLTRDGEKTTQVSIAKPVWVQLFTAGSIFKNVSIFIETEVNTEKKEIHSSWFRLGFHNLFGTSLLNLRVGNTSALEWTAASGRLRMIGPVKNYVLSDVKSSAGKGEDSVSLAAAVPGFSLYGYKGVLLYEVGISNGAKLTDSNQYKNYWATLRLENNSGSAISFYITRGTDTANTAKAQIKNDFTRFNPAVNYRKGNFDLIATYVYGIDKNWNLSATAPTRNVFAGYSLLAGYFYKSKFYGALQYDLVKCDDYKKIEFNTLTPSLWYHLRDNMKVGVTARFDLLGANPVFHPYRQNSYFVTIRTMF